MRQQYTPKQNIKPHTIKNMILQETFRCMYIEHIATICTISKNIYCEDKKKKEKKKPKTWRYSLSKNEGSISFTISLYLCLQRTSRKILNQFLWNRHILSIRTMVADDSPLCSSSRLTASNVSLFKTLWEYKSTMISLGFSFL